MNNSYIQESTLITSIWHENIHEYLSPNIVQIANASGNEKKIYDNLSIRQVLKGFLKLLTIKNNGERRRFDRTSVIIE